MYVESNGDDMSVGAYLLRNSSNEKEVLQNASMRDRVQIEEMVCQSEAYILANT